MSQGGTGRQRRVSRAKLQERRLQAAAAGDGAPSYDVIVGGGGASGRGAAICAGEKGAHVLLLESSPECGRPLLATGNGRCNFSNVGLAPKYYNDPAFVQAVFGGDDADPGVHRGAQLALARGHGLGLGDDGGDLGLKLLLLELEHGQEALKPLQRVRLGLELRLRQLDLRHRRRLYHILRPCGVTQYFSESSPIPALKSH